MVDDLQTDLPGGELSAADVVTGGTLLRDALDASPDNDDVLDAMNGFKQDVGEQVRDDIERRELNLADEILTAASGIWPESELFGDTGELRSALDSALEERRIGEEVSELIDAAQEALSGGSSGVVSIEGFGAALRLLSQALDRAPSNERAQALRDNIRRDLMASARRELDARNPDHVQEFLDVAQNEWPGDDDFARQRAELSQLRDALARAEEVQRLIDLGDRQFAAGNLITSPVDSAVDYFRRAQNLDPDSEGASAGLARVTDRHVVLIRAATVLNDTDEARRLLAILIDLAPEHPEIPKLMEEIKKAEEPQGPLLIAGDEETRFWSASQDSCNSVELYLATYPDGRYKAEAERVWRGCRLETR